ncbi:MAG TPA: hypothetical protein PK280_15750 [Planctomycetota bacterium]|nr:hypothetical protein [Planctomycetota bacterium]
MPEMNTGYTQDFRAANQARQVPLGQGVENFVKFALPSVAHLSVLRYLIERGKETSSAGEVAQVVCEPKAAVQAALEHFEKLEIARSSMSLLGRKFAILPDGPKVDAARKIIKLWDHPQTHASLLALILRSTPKA